MARRVGGRRDARIARDRSRDWPRVARGAVTAAAQLPERAMQACTTAREGRRRGGLWYARGELI